MSHAAVTVPPKTKPFSFWIFCFDVSLACTSRVYLRVRCSDLACDRFEEYVHYVFEAVRLSRWLRPKAFRRWSRVDQRTGEYNVKGTKMTHRSRRISQDTSANIGVNLKTRTNNYKYHKSVDCDFIKNDVQININPMNRLIF